MRRFIAVLPSFVRLFRLSLGLLLDRRVPLRLKALPALALAYIVSPVDLIPDIIPLLGQLDDIVVAFALLSLFTALAPAEIARRKAGQGERRDTGESGNVVEGRFHYIDED